MGHTKRLPAFSSLALVAAVVTLALPAQAEAPPVKPEAIEVSLAGLDLSNPDHLAKLSGRVDAAAKQACAGELSHSPLAPRSHAAEARCVDSARADFERTLAAGPAAIAAERLAAN